MEAEEEQIFASHLNGCYLFSFLLFHCFNFVSNAVTLNGRKNQINNFFMISSNSCAVDFIAAML